MTVRSRRSLTSIDSGKTQTLGTDAGDDAGATWAMCDDDGNALIESLESRHGTKANLAMYVLGAVTIVEEAVRLKIVSPYSGADEERMRDIRNGAFYRGRDAGRKFMRNKIENPVVAANERAEYWKRRARAAEGGTRALPHDHVKQIGDVTVLWTPRGLVVARPGTDADVGRGKALFVTSDSDESLRPAPSVLGDERREEPVNDMYSNDFHATGENE